MNRSWPGVRDGIGWDRKSKMSPTLHKPLSFELEVELLRLEKAHA